ncbi:MAG: alpha-L-fucosidase [Erysipelotrichaceae bacterium]|nr:alpha-L-fucosidase [Erysipelotrichaceae bacterium]MDY4972044.1 alpha-L-fucosidase [Erysipelotrichaceae bacterium]MDY5997685.1 alpha-L-fucosidase [Erysipelotrichaceae bacterium]
MSIPVPEKRIAHFEKLGFGMFIHWGLYSQLERGEWTFDLHKDSIDKYPDCFNNFTAEDFDAKAICQLAKKAGMKYITLTTRHHDGFSLYDTKGLSDYDVMHTPCKRDLIKEFVDACNEEGLMPMLYHTTLDWQHPDFNNDFDAYLEYLRKSVEILCTNYGKIGGLWFDGNWSKRGADWKLDELYGMIHRLQPDAMVINNTGLSEQGKTGHPEIDSVTFEQGQATVMNREGMDKYVAAEMCQTMNRHWGIAVNDLDYKSPRQMIERLCHARKVGANYLLNIGLTGQGGVTKITEALLEIIGQWTSMAKESLYEGKPSTMVCNEDKDFVLEKDGYAYIYVHDLPLLGPKDVVVAYEKTDGDHSVRNVNRKVKSMKWVDNNEELLFTQDDDVLKYRATGYYYGTQLIVRIAKVEFEKG